MPILLRISDKVKSPFRQSKPDDVVLNQPVRALVRSILWWMGAFIFASPPLGVLALQIARIHPLRTVFENIAGVFLSGVVAELFGSLMVVALMAYPAVVPSRVPRPLVDRRDAP